MSKKKRPVSPRAADSRSVTPDVLPSRPEQPTAVRVANQPVIPTEPKAGPVASSSGLIRFDKRVRLFLFICAGLFVLLTLARINYSSIALWNQILPDGSDPKRGLITGSPHTIRLDEWGVMTPSILSQANRGYPIQNPGIGGDNTPLLMNLPVKHFITVFRPDCWGFLLFGAETGFAWWWNFKYFFALAAVTLFFLVLTRNNFWLSVFGGLWIVFSSGMVWWSMSFTFWIGMGCLVYVVFMELLYTPRKRPLLWLGMLLFYLSTTFAINLYPPLQISLAYVLIALIIGYVVQYKLTAVWVNLPLKVAALVGAVGLIGLVGVLYYRDAQSTLDTMTHTAYPGQRADVGGEGFIANWFSEYYSWMLSDTKLPANWMNISEASHYITFAPVVWLGLLLCFVRTRRIEPLLIATTVVSLVLLSFMQFGWPEWLSRATLMSRATSARVQLTVGIANVILTVLYLNYLSALQLKPQGRFLLAGVAGVLAIMAGAAVLNLNDGQGFFKGYQLILPTAFFTVLGVLLLPDIRFQYRAATFGGALLLFLLPNLRINPVAIGMSPIVENVVYKTIQAIQQRDPNARWVIFGAQPLTFMASATGINQISGFKNQPDLPVMRVLDPTTKRDSIYNRHARPVWVSYVDGRDSVVINPGEAADTYLLGVDPCSPKLRQLKVKYFLFDHQPQPVETRCLKLIQQLGSIAIYETNP